MDDGSYHPQSADGGGKATASAYCTAGERSRARRSGPSRSAQSAFCAAISAGAIDNDVDTMQPTMIFNPNARAWFAMASASVRPPVMKQVMQRKI